MNMKIRKWQIDDAKDLAAALSNVNVLNNLRDGLPYPYTENNARDYITSMLKADDSGTFSYAIEVDGKVVGSIGAFRGSNIHYRTAELGYYIAEEYWGKGIMTAAVVRVCDMVFSKTDIIRIYAEPFAHNTGSRRVLEKAGFRLEGIMRRNAFKNGQMLDMTLYALTRNTQKYPVRRLTADELPSALSLIWDVFCEFDAPLYTEEGVRQFRKALNDGERNKTLNFYGAFDGDDLVGVIAVRKPQHIGFFFVRSDHHRCGIGKRLFETMRCDFTVQEFTVNASPYAVEVYKHLGFSATDAEQTENGLRYTPMKYSK